MKKKHRMDLFREALPLLLLLSFLFPASLLPQAFLHEKITLRGMDGAPLALESKALYSPKKTCGVCHDYARITNGYHFQLGRTDGKGEIVVRGRFSPTSPWNLSSGMYGRHWLASPDASQLARKENNSPSSIDKSSFYFVQHCGPCHPGGGPGEYDRQGNLYYDEKTGKSGFELMEKTYLLDGDYTPYSTGKIGFGAPWNRSGVSEADCLICHLKGYRWDDRASALRGRDFRYGPTVGAGWTVLKRSEEATDLPVLEEVEVDYSKKEVADFENLHLQIIRKTPDENCWFCHATPCERKSGREWSAETDVHKEKGLTCLSCHPCDREHNFAKGNSIHQAVRDDLDQTMFSCEDCHDKGKDRRAPRYRHPFSPRHMKRIACQSCHIPYRLTPADLVYDLASDGTPRVYDTARFFSNEPLLPGSAVAGPDPTPWSPQLREFKGRIVPVKSLIVLYWGDLDEGTNRVKPIPLWKIRALTRPPLQDDDGDGFVEVNTHKEIQACLNVLKRTDPFGEEVAQNPVLIKGGFLYRLDAQGEIERLKHEQAVPVDVSLSHNILSGPRVIGARGCKDCHSKDSPFFLRKILVDPFDETGKPLYQEAWERLGIDKERLHRLLLPP